MKKSYRIIVKGKVQRIGYRYFVYQIAVKYNISGTVANKSDGSVLIKAEGTENQLELFFDKCKEGTPWSRIDSFSMEEIPSINKDSFSIR